MTYYNDLHSASATINYSFDGRGNRLDDDDSIWESPDVDLREYTYDARNNLITVEGKAPTYPADGTTYNYTLTNAYDHLNRRIFKSFLNGTSSVESQWFFYYDLNDRLIEVKHTPDVSTSSVYSLYQFYYIGQRPVAYWQVDYPGATTTKRYYRADDINRPLLVLPWTDYASSVWSAKPDLFGWDYLSDVGDGGASQIYQPLRFPGQYWDEETAAWIKKYTFSSTLYIGRPGLHDNRYRVYDPFTGTYMQVDPKVDGDTWEAYNYAGQNPVMRVDPTAGIGDQISGPVAHSGPEGSTSCQLIETFELVPVTVSTCGSRSILQPPSGQEATIGGGIVSGGGPIITTEPATVAANPYASVIPSPSGSGVTGGGYCVSWATYVVYVDYVCVSDCDDPSLPPTCFPQGHDNGNFNEPGYLPDDIQSSTFDYDVYKQAFSPKIQYASCGPRSCDKGSGGIVEPVEPGGNGPGY